MVLIALVVVRVRLRQMVRGVGPVLRFLRLIVELVMQVRGIGVCLVCGVVRIASLVMLVHCHLMASSLVDVTVMEPSLTGRRGRCARFELKNMTCHAMRRIIRMIERHWDAGTKCWMLGMGHRSDDDVVTMQVRLRCMAHDDVWMRYLPSSPDLLNRLHVDYVALAKRDRHRLRLVENGRNAQACKTESKIKHCKRR